MTVKRLSAFRAIRPDVAGWVGFDCPGDGIATDSRKPATPDARSITMYSGSAPTVDRDAPRAEGEAARGPHERHLG